MGKKGQKTVFPYRAKIIRTKYLADGAGVGSEQNRQNPSKNVKIRQKMPQDLPKNVRLCEKMQNFHVGAWILVQFYWGLWDLTEIFLL